MLTLLNRLQDALDASRRLDFLGPLLVLSGWGALVGSLFAWLYGKLLDKSR